ncbi:hypothetical protein HanXRQr2_Chr05g0227601 [Helianthus annuus]|uniref:Uncharacterized protein n=1 Tax=Helianthus annuus TaxID=4232 RepID=A0A251US51_HELAN|nr:hypothetical protein HanXRQr2_Chr05g0227601 [Helianthus annuus]KAJ0923744.1 hypothetical protein HanPSC8_Chr05g0219641 [Helianthus annuus]
MLDYFQYKSSSFRKQTMPDTYTLDYIYTKLILKDANRCVYIVLIMVHVYITQLMY